MIRALLVQKLLPPVISGASGGSIPAALVAVHTDEELHQLINPKISSIYGKTWFDPLPTQVLHFLRHGVLMKSTRFADTVTAYFKGSRLTRGVRILCVLAYGFAVDLGFPIFAHHVLSSSSGS